MSFRVRCEETRWTRLDGSPYVTVSKLYEDRSEAERRAAVLNAAKVCDSHHSVEEVP